MMKTLIDKVATKLGYCRIRTVREQLDFAYSVGKRLDEHRELVEAIERDSDLFENKGWHIDHMATQDDYLMRLYRLAHGVWPDPIDQHDPNPQQCTGDAVRRRPSILGSCRLPEYP